MQKTRTSWFKDKCASLGSKFHRVRMKHLLVDLPIFVFCDYLALWLRVGQDFSSFLGSFTLLIPLFLLVRVGIFIWVGAYDILWRYVSIRDIGVIASAVSLSSVFNICLTYMLDMGRISRGVFVINTVLLTCVLITARLLRRYLHEYPALQKVKEDGRRTLIVGAGRNGVTIAHRIMTDEMMGYQPIGFIDDDPEKIGRMVAGLNVIGSTNQLEEVVNRYKITEVIVAVGKPSGDLLAKVMQVCLHRQIAPRLIKVASGASSRGSHVDVLRDIDLNDLLSRQPRNIDLRELRETVNGKCVLITGAGGSIGSELARQIFRMEPEKLLLFDHSEFNLYEIDKELRGNSKVDRVIPLLADIKNRRGLEQVFKQYRPTLVFHAAAYKHVHLVEANPVPAILNNVMGTKNLVELSMEYDVESFVLISTDKAVNPAGIMGATKRVCELMVTAAGQKVNRRFASVRFGNVLGSSGSLVPLIKDQVHQGLPVTITHPDMKRFFMLIPEAVSLVLKASTLSRPGDIMVLKMGDPVRIVELAKSLILMMGKTEAEVPIVFTGMRPGEKLVEELYLTGAEERTSDPDIMVVPRGDAVTANAAYSYEALFEIIDWILWEANNGKPGCAYRLKNLIFGGFSNEELTGAAKPKEFPTSIPMVGRDLPPPARPLNLN